MPDYENNKKTTKKPSTVYKDKFHNYKNINKLIKDDFQVN